MIKHLKVAFVSFVLSAVMATSVFAEKRVALVIGNGAYEAIGKLKNPANDAMLISKTLAELGFEVTAAYDQTEDQMGDIIDSFVELARRADVAVVYYAGHGLQRDGENYLMPIDAKLKSASAISREGIALNDLTSSLANVSVSMIFLDACRNNPFAEALLSAAQSDDRSTGIKRGLAVVRTPGDMLVAFATLPNTVAADGREGNSPFARALATHITTPDVEVSVLMKRVTADVMNATDGEQRPQQLSQMMTEFYFSYSGDTPQVAASAPIIKPGRSLLSVYPPRVTIGDEISIVADVNTACTPSFFNLAPDWQLTPIPLDFFKTTNLANGQTRYEMSPGSQFALVVQEQDAKGENNLGYFCVPPDVDDKRVRQELVKSVVASISDDIEDGTVSGSSFDSIAFQARPFIIE